MLKEKKIDIIAIVFMAAFVGFCIHNYSFVNGQKDMTAVYSEMVSINKRIKPPKIPFGHFKVDKLVSNETFFELFVAKKTMPERQEHFYKNIMMPGTKLQAIPDIYLPEKPEHNIVWEKKLGYWVSAIGNECAYQDTLIKAYKWTQEDVNETLQHVGGKYLLEVLKIQITFREKVIADGINLPEELINLREKKLSPSPNEFFYALSQTARKKLLKHAQKLTAELNDVYALDTGWGSKDGVITPRRHLRIAINAAFLLGSSAFDQKKRALIERQAIQQTYLFVSLDLRSMGMFPLHYIAYTEALETDVDGLVKTLKDAYRYEAQRLEQYFATGCCAELLITIPKYNKPPLQEIAKTWRKMDRADNRQKALAAYAQALEKDNKKMLKAAYDFLNEIK